MMKNTNITGEEWATIVCCQIAKLTVEIYVVVKKKNSGNNNFNLV